MLKPSTPISTHFAFMHNAYCDNHYFGYCRSVGYDFVVLSLSSSPNFVDPNAKISFHKRSFDFHDIRSCSVFGLALLYKSVRFCEAITLSFDI